MIAARNEAERIGGTIAALQRAMPGTEVIVGDDASDDETAAIARGAGATVVTSPRSSGKGGNASAAASAALELLGSDVSRATVLLCDADLAGSAEELLPLIEAVERGDADLAVAGFARKEGGGFGMAKGFARWAIRRRSGFVADSPISGQRALRAAILPDLLPFAPVFGMEIGMTVDAVRAGHRVVEVELPLTHRATGRTLGGFIHRGRQLRDFIAVYAARRRPRG